MFLNPVWRFRQAKSFVGSVVSGGNCGFGVWRQSIWRIYCPSILDESAENGLAADGSRSVSLFTGSLNRLHYIWLGLLVAAVTQRFVESFFMSISWCCSFKLTCINFYNCKLWNYLNMWLISIIEKKSGFNKYYLYYTAFVTQLHKLHRRI